MNKKYTVSAIIAFIIFVVMTGLVLFNKFAVIDNLSFLFMSNIHSNLLTTILKTLTHFGSTMLIIGLIIVAIFTLKNNKDRIFLVGTMAYCEVMNLLLKYLFRIDRPDLEALIFEDGYSYPSGHSMAAMALYSLFIYFIWKSKIAKNLKIFFTIVFILLIIVVGFSRIYLGVHHLSDVIAAFAASHFLVWFAIFCKEKELIFKNIA